MNIFSRGEIMNVSKYVVTSINIIVIVSIIIDSANAKTIINVNSIVDTLAFSSNGHILAAGSQDAAIRFWEVPKMLPILKEIKSDFPVNSVSYFHNSNTILTQGSLLPIANGLDFQLQ